MREAAEKAQESVTFHRETTASTEPSANASAEPCVAPSSRAVASEQDSPNNE